MRALPEVEEHRGWLFRDFASGIAAIREAVRDGIPHTMLRLSDGSETRFLRGFSRLGHEVEVRQRLEQAWLDLRKFDGCAFYRTARRLFDGRIYVPQTDPET